MNVTLPIDAVTFLFTDIEGSTALWEERSAEMASALERHDRVLRLAIESAAGRIVKTTGDGVVAVFAEAKSALVGAVAAQLALQTDAGGAASPAPVSEASEAVVLRVRMGLHTGIAGVRDGDYFGTSLNRAARIMSAAYGEQILLSADTAELVSGDLPEGVVLRDLGEYRLKGLSNPERLLQVVASGLRTEFPLLASVTGHTLPAEHDVFVGRNEALANLERHFGSGARLVSILATGGSGKTRLVTRFGWSVLTDFTGGVWFCDLTPARNVDGVVHAVAGGLGVPLGRDEPVLQLGQAIAGRGRCLIILDNFEQVARYAGQTLGHWLDRAPNARFLVTTREVLGLPSEEILALGPLALSDAIELFVRRTKAAKPGFEPTPEDMAAIAALVPLLDGLPLAIELAAVRVRVMSPQTLLLRMDERFKLLSAGGGRVDRQATLRAVFDWSWDLLSLPEKAAFTQLSVFEGGFTLDAAEAILDLSRYDSAPWPVDAVQSLVQKSLVRQDTDERFYQLVSVQEYAAEHLRTDGRYDGSGAAARLAAETRHGRYFANLGDREATARTYAELDNFIAACRRASARGDADVASKTLERAWEGLSLRGPFRAGLELISTVESSSCLGPPEMARVNLVAGSTLAACGRDAEASERFKASLAAAREVGDRDCECKALVKLGFHESQHGSTGSGRADLQAALAIAVELNDTLLQSDVQNTLGNLERVVGRPEEARAHLEQALALAREGGSRVREGVVLANLASVYANIGLSENARTHQEAALAVAREVGDRRLEGNTLCNLGLLHAMEGRLDDARNQLEAALTVARELGHRLLECIVLCNLGMVDESLDDLDAAQSHLERALAIAREIGHGRSEGQVLGYLGLVLGRRAAYAEARRCINDGETLLRALSDADSLGIVLAQRAETEGRAGDAHAARVALSAAEEIATETAPGPLSELGHAVARARKSLDL